ncbi:hypothetical protein [Microbacterium rhizophilus]|uniref:hypothetical protein n=1 Tax=Microbacterium rhizophilus TaxID=3138934 RepID=UPI0031EFEE70
MTRSTTHSALAVAVLAVIALGATACGASAPAQKPREGVSSSPVCAAATLTVTPDRGAPGTVIEVGGAGYIICGDTPDRPSEVDPVSVVDVHWIEDGSTTSLGQAEIAEDGTLSGSFTVPEDAAGGTVQLWAGDGLHVSSETVDFTVD